MNAIKTKVCGLTRDQDFETLADMGVDYGGLIFYKPSPRFVGDKLTPKRIRKVKTLQKIGVFVNAKQSYIKEKIDLYGLDLVQLHGDESPEFCTELQKTVLVIKAFRIQSAADLKIVEAYKNHCSYFLFDAAGKHYGGNGVVFKWAVLKEYTGSTPFFLSGGIGLNQIEDLRSFTHPAWHSIDVNSQFEEQPGLKNIKKINTFLQALHISK